MPKKSSLCYTYFRLRLTTSALCGCVLYVALLDASGNPPALHAAAYQSIRSALDSGRYDEAEKEAQILVSTLETLQVGQPVDLSRAKNLLIEALSLNGRSAEQSTLKLAQQVVDDEESQLDADRRELAVGLRNLGDVLFQTAEYERARIALEDAVALAERYTDVDPAELAESLDHFARALTRCGRYDDASRVLNRALEIKRASLSPSDIRIARTLETIAWLLHRTGEYARARPFLERAMKIREMADPENPEIISTLNTFGDQFWFEGNALDARELYLRALAVGEKTLRPDHPDIAVCLKNLATAVEELGNLTEAKLLKVRAATIAENSLGSDNPQLAGYLNNLANTNMGQGDYAAARALYDRALKIREDRFGRDHVDVATIVHNLALVHARLGDFAESRRLHDRAIAIWQRHLGPMHPYVGLALFELAKVFSEEGFDTQARPLFEQALAIRKTTLGPNHPDVARTLAELARCLAQLHWMNRAEQLSAQAVDIWERSKTPDTAGAATALEINAALRADEGDYISARQEYERALEINRRIVGPFHPDFAATQANLAKVLARLREPSATAYALQAESVGRSHLRSTLRYLPERESLAYAAKRPKGLDLALSLLTTGSEPRDVIDALIRGRSLILDEMVARRRSLSNAAGSDITPLWTALAFARQRLANLVVRGPSEEHPEQYLPLVEEARRDKELAERALADQSATFRDELARAEIGLDEVRTALPPGSALVSFARYDRMPVNDSATRPGSTPADGGHYSHRTVPSYIAFVISADRSGVSAVPLGPAAGIDALVARWRSEATDVRRLNSGREAERTCRAAGAELRKRVWDVIAGHLDGATTVFVVPDGTLNLVSLAALPIGQTRYLIDNGPVIHYLSAERDLVTGASAPNVNHGLLAVGGADFDDSTLFTSAPAHTPAPKPQSASIVPQGHKVRASCGDLQSVRFDALEVTRKEVQEVANLWTESPIQVLESRDANERAFKQAAPGHRVLHLATHGFFLGSTCSPAVAGTRSVGGLSTPQKSLSNVGLNENPLLQSGLALAGANRRAAAGPDDEDGILTAEEVGALNLEGVEWAVLSACDTGLGQVKVGEGVFGLRRAFQVAGVRTVIMSLWSVEDRSTLDWMRALYVGRLQKKLGTADAIHEASLTVLSARRARGLSTHPFYWGGFVGTGDWR